MFKHRNKIKRLALWLIVMSVILVQLSALFLHNGLIWGGLLLLVGLGAARLCFPTGWRLLHITWLVGFLAAIICYVAVDIMLILPGASLAAVAVGYALMRQFSTVSDVWAEDSLGVIALLLVPALVLVALNIAAPGSVTGWGWALYIVGVHGLYLAHNHLALIHPQPQRTYAMYWFSFGLIGLFIGNGLIGAFMAVVDVHPLSADSVDMLRKLYIHVTLWAVMAMLLGTVNQCAAILRGDLQRHVTGLLPFWTISGGVMAGALVLFAHTCGQIVLDLAGHTNATVLSPLDELYRLTQGSVLLGLALYSAGFIRRLPLR